MDMTNKPDTTADQRAAEEQARQITAFWAGRGKTVLAWAELDRKAGLPTPLWVVRSDAAMLLRRA
jgi:hypothetical protein